MKTMTEEHGHVVPAATLVKVWAALVVLTGVLVGASLVSHTLAVWAMLTVTPVKAWLVLTVFMHLRYERTLLKGMAAVALCVLVTFIGMMFLDLAFR